MKAIVLCAGMGTRVQPVTFPVPKSRINIIDKPILSFILSHLKSAGEPAEKIHDTRFTGKVGDSREQSDCVFSSARRTKEEINGNTGLLSA